MRMILSRTVSEMGYEVCAAADMMDVVRIALEEGACGLGLSTLEEAMTSMPVDIGLPAAIEGSRVFMRSNCPAYALFARSMYGRQVLPT